MTNTLDWTKPIQTRDGRKARVWDEPLSDGRRVVVVTHEGGEEVPGVRLSNGVREGWSDGDEGGRYDIINAPEPEYWLVMRPINGPQTMGVPPMCLVGVYTYEDFARDKAGPDGYIAKLILVAPEKENDDG